MTTVAQEFMKKALQGKSPAKFLKALKKERNNIIPAPHLHLDSRNGNGNENVLGDSQRSRLRHIRCCM